VLALLLKSASLGKKWLHVSFPPPAVGGRAVGSKSDLTDHRVSLS